MHGDPLGQGTTTAFVLLYFGQFFLQEHFCRLRYITNTNVNLGNNLNRKRMSHQTALALNQTSSTKMVSIGFILMVRLRPCDRICCTIQYGQNSTVVRIPSGRTFFFHFPLQTSKLSISHFHQPTPTANSQRSANPHSLTLPEA